MKLSTRRRKEFLLPSLFVMFSFSLLLPISGWKVLGGILFLFIYILYLFRILVQKQMKEKGGPFSKELFIGLAYLAINVLGVLVYGSASYINILFFGMALFFFVFASYLDWNQRIIGFISFFIIGFLLVNIIIILISGISNDHVRGFFSNANVFGAYTGFLTYFPLLNIINSTTKKSRIFWISIFTIMIGLVYISGTRSVVLSLFVGLLVYTFFGVISKTRILYNFFFFLVITIILSFITIYPILNKFSFFNTLDTFITSKLGKPIYTGREEIWAGLLGIIKDKPFFGHGPGATANMYLDLNLSAHNLFLQTALQSGWVGFGLLFLILFSIWQRFRIGIINKEVRLTAAFLIAIIVHQTFEISLTQNNIVIGILQWLILAIGTSYTLKYNFECGKSESSFTKSSLIQ